MQQSWKDKVDKLLQKVGNNIYLQAISAAMMGALAPIMVGAIALLVVIFANYPFGGFIKPLVPILTTVNAVTMGAMALYIVFMAAYCLCEQIEPHGTYGVGAGILALMTFLIFTPLEIKTGKNPLTALPTTWLGAQGVFSAIIIGLVVARVYLFLISKKLTIKMPNTVPPMISRVFEALIPTILIGVLAIVIAAIFAATPLKTFHQLVYTLLQLPLKHVGGTITAMIIVSIIQEIIWFFGIHGTNVIMPIVTPIWLSMDMENAQALIHHQALPNIIGAAFFATVTWSGMGLGLAVLMLLAKSKRYKQVGKVSIIPAIFGITEPIIFGTPLVLNFDLAIPFIFNNAVALTLAYWLTKLGIMAKFPGTQQIFGLPIGLHAAVFGHLSIILFQVIVQGLLAPLWWYPWFKRIDRREYALEQAEEN